MATAQTAPVPTLAHTLGKRPALRVASFTIGSEVYEVRFRWDARREFVYLQIADPSKPNRDGSKRWKSVLRRPRETPTWRALQFVQDYLLPKDVLLALDPAIKV